MLTHSTATSRGLRQYTTEPFALCYQDEEGDIALMEMLFTTRLVAVVLSPRVLRVINTKRSAMICELSFPLKILAVKLNRKRLAVVLDNQIYLYDISNMKLLHTIDTSPNPHGLCALSPSSENNFMVFPLPQKENTQSYSQPAHRPPSGSFLPPQSGEALVFDAGKLEAVNVIRAHQSALGCIAINGDGTILATASEKGTVIRVFSVPGGEKLFHFRRGSLPTQIFCMSFNPTSTLLSVSSATETVHIFKLIAQTKDSTGSAPPSPTSPKSLGKQRRASTGSRDRSTSPASDDFMESHEIEDSAMGADKKPQTQSLMSMIRRTSQSVGLSLAQRAGEYLPSSVTEIFEPARDFAWVKVPRQSKPAINNWPVRSVVAMSANHPQLMVVTSEGQFYVFNIDLENGGEGVLEHQYP
jgi:autophagy-related protein 18